MIYLMTKYFYRLWPIYYTNCFRTFWFLRGWHEGRADLRDGM